MLRRYSELKLLATFEERYEYLRLKGVVGAETFGFDRYLNQTLYKIKRWREARDYVILRDNGCDLGIPDRIIGSRLIVHHMNPLTIQDILDGNEDVFNPEYLISTSHQTHNAIHYGDENLLIKDFVEREPGDTCLWARGGARWTAS